MEFVRKNAPGILICLVIAVPAWLLGQRFEVVGGPVFAILIGMVIALFWKDQKSAKSGITYTSKKVLQLAVVLLGFGMNLSSVLQVGGQSLPIIVSTIATSLIVAFALYKALHMDSNISTLIGVGSSICGGSAIAATAPVIGADDEEIAQAISVIFLFNVIAALIFPTLGGVLGLSNEGFGLFAGTAVNDTSSVTAAAAAWDGMHPGANTLDTAAIVKMTRTLAIIPITLVLALLGLNHCLPDGLALPGVGYCTLGPLAPVVWLVILVALAESARTADGMDGTVCGCAFIAMLGLMTAMTLLGWFPLGVLPAALAGALMAFLLWNFYPAKLRPGAVGCQFLAGALGCVPLSVGWPGLTLPLALPYWLEGGMVALQIIVWKASGGRRQLFGTAPLHRWLEKRGFDPVNIFYIFGVLAMLGLALTLQAARAS